MTMIRFLATALFALWSSLSMAQAETDRLALVVGNAAYTEIPALDNPGNDAGLMGSVLRAAGFEVTYLFDANQTELNAAIVAFGRMLRERGPDTVGLFYYAGHGVQSQGKNYLMPIDAELTDAVDLDLVAVEADVILRQMGSAKNSTNIVILDACRSNPFAALDGFDKNGLAEMKARPGTFLSYSTGPGDVALDGLGRHSPFTAALAREMQVEGAPIEQVFKKVRIDVVGETRGIQTPWETSLLTTDFAFFPTDDAPAEPDAERTAWASVSQDAAPLDLIRFLRSYPDGRFADMARSDLSVALAGDPQGGGVAVRAADTGGGPSPKELALFETARVSGRVADYRAYLRQYPGGAFATLANLEIEARE